MPDPSYSQSRGLSEDVFLAARDKFLASLPADAKSNWEQCRTSKELLSEASKLNSFRTSRRLTAKPIEALDKFSKHLEPYFEIIDSVIQSNLKAAVLVWSAIRLILKLASNFGGFFDKLTQLLDEYGQKLPQFEEALQFTPSEYSNRFRDCLKNIYLDLFELFTAIARVFSKENGLPRRAPIVLMTLPWQPFNIRFDNFMNRLKQHREVFHDERELMQLRVSLESHSLQKNQLEQAEEYQKKYYELIQEIESGCDAARREETIRDIDHWVNPPKSQRVMQPFDDATGQCLLGTCQWVFEEQTFKSWMANDTITMNLDAAFAKILWIKGNPGSGKTVLATEILQKLQERCSEHSSQATAFQFFSFRYEITRISRTGWSMVLSQLLRQLRNFDRILDQFTFAMTKSEKPQATSGELIELLQAVARGLPGLVLLFDGVDETDDPEEFTSTVSHILEGTSAKVVIVSRPNIKILLDRLDQVPNIHLTREKAQPDIQNYIRCRGSNFGPDDFPPQFSLRFVEEKILLGSNGIILWAKVMLDYLQFGFLDADERAEAIQSLKIHEEITDMYIRILNKIATKNEFIRNRARRIFSWLAFSIHYLQENELWEVICSLKKRSDSPGLLNDPTPTKAQIEEFQKLVIMSCACLVERVRGEYRFVHQSVVEFFWKGLDERKCQSPNIEQFLPSPSQAHNELTAECLSYLLLRVPAKPLSGNIKAGVSKLELSSHIPFAAYAATSWPAHLEKGASFLEESLIMSGSALQRSDIQSILQLLPVLKQFTSAKLSLMVWIEIRYVIGSNISDLIGIRGWSALTRRLSGAYSQLPESFRDLPTTLDAFFTEFEHLDVQWGLTFKEKPHYIWNDSTAFMNTQFLQKTAAVSVSSMIASNFDDGTLSSEPLATCSYSVSNTANGDERLGNLSIWPTRTFEAFAAGLKKESDQIPIQVSSGWVARFEVWDTQPVNAVKLNDIRFRLNDKEVFEHMKSSLKLRKISQTRTSTQKNWSLPFPMVISPNLDMLIILQTVCFLLLGTTLTERDAKASEDAQVTFFSLKGTSHQGASLSATGSSRPSSARIPPTSLATTSAQSYGYKVSLDGKYLLQETTRCLPGLFRISKANDSQIFELRIMSVDRESRRCNLLSQYRPPKSMMIIRACRFHPSMPILLFHTVLLGEPHQVFLWSFVRSAFVGYSNDHPEEDPPVLSSPCPPKRKIEKLNFSDNGNEIIIELHGRPHPEVVRLHENPLYNEVLTHMPSMLPQHDALIIRAPPHCMDLSSSVSGFLGLQVTAGEMQLSSHQALVVGSSAYRLNLNVTQNHNTLRATHTSSNNQTTQDILSLPNNFKIDQSIETTIAPSASKDNSLKIVMNQGPRPFYDLGKTAEAQTKTCFPMVAHKSVQALLPAESTNSTHAGTRKRPASMVDNYNDGNPKKLSRHSDGHQLLEFVPESSNAIESQSPSDILDVSLWFREVAETSDKELSKP